jgi:hypothetical protein
MQSTLPEHFLTFTDRYGKPICATVVYAKRLSNGVEEVHITMSDWLDPYSYEATYFTSSQSATGIFVLSSCQLTEGGTWLYKGIFTRFLPNGPESSE